jgi:hypothetical protein
MKDLIIGMACGYTDEQLKPFVNSLKRTGYNGDLVLIRQNPYAVHPILSRFDLIPRYINHQRWVIAIDTSDVVFQSNPIDWLEQNAKSHELVVVSEQVTFQESEGNRYNMLAAFPQYWEQIKNREVFNAGVIAGKARTVKEICEQIYLLCLQDARINGAPIKKLEWQEMISDQSALNILLDNYPCVLRANASSNFVHEYSHPGNGENAAILHQYLYNRGEEIRQKYS